MVTAKDVFDFPHEHRYTVRLGTDSMGSSYASGPLTFVDTDDLAEAMAYVHKQGRGEVVDHETRNCWSPSMGWYHVE